MHPYLQGTCILINKKAKKKKKGQRTKKIIWNLNPSLTRKIYDQLDKTGGIWLVQNSWCTKICTNGVTVSQTIVHYSYTNSSGFQESHGSICLPIRKLSQQEKKRQMVISLTVSLSLSLSFSLALSRFCRAEEWGGLAWLCSISLLLSH